MQTPCHIQYVVNPEDGDRAAKLFDRISDVNRLLSGDRAGETIAAIFAEKPLNEETTGATLSGLLRDARWSLLEDDNDIFGSDD